MKVQASLDVILISVSLKPTNICVIHVNFRTVKNCKSGFITVFDQVESKNDGTYFAIVRAGDCQMGLFIVPSMYHVHGCRE